MNSTIVISAAGRGSRLGKGIPKSLVYVGDRRILEWQLTMMCRPDDCVHLVVGYMGDEVARLANSLHPNIRIFYNRDWESTKTAASLSLGAAPVLDRCVSLDGDLLVHPEDFRSLIECDQDMIGITPVISAEPVHANVDSQGICHALDYEPKTEWEWTGLVNFHPDRIPPGSNHVFEMIQCMLPSKTFVVRSIEIDTMEDLLFAPFAWDAIRTNTPTEALPHGQGQDRSVLASAD